MKVHLMYREADFIVGADRHSTTGAVFSDLELRTLCSAMAGDDEYLFDVARAALGDPLTEPAAICFRQDVLRDCVSSPVVVRSIYGLAVEAIELSKKSYFGFYSKYPSAMLGSARELMETFVRALRKIREIADSHSADFRSTGFVRFFRMIEVELTDEYFELIARHLKTLRFRRGVLIGARLGPGNKGQSYTLRKPADENLVFSQRMFKRRRESYGFHIPERDEAGAQALSELEAKGIDLVARALNQSAEHVLDFFNMLRCELAFYIGCVNLHDGLLERGYSMCMPEVAPVDMHGLDARGLREVCLALRTSRDIVPNDLHAHDRDLVVITGANEGGKSTFLRSVAIAQLMMQTGMMVLAEQFSSSASTRIFTHFKREEDESMTSGKFDEELRRVSAIIDQMEAASIVFFNESFASTNEREGAEVAGQIVRALLDKSVRVFFVTHMYALSNELHESQIARAIFLRAERTDEGGRTYRLVQGAPLDTSFGEDLYRDVFPGE
ncbi:DNA mismatch repair protein MutS [Burkholderia pseudomultivorans]|uniref:DNA mismatch repair protein MutS n=1 Tax=Burkholderia pseudomultivorans TaxID=1207504 RepID=A0A6P2RNS8_9BURK|nr:DNA mismatch repair protein MutS [Burkholderia pseudomultivorans]VWC31748.1 DNA mismatch repair protein MutS [Burkholderia pseudomultivorans]